MSPENRHIQGEYSEDISTTGEDFARLKEAYFVESPDTIELAGRFFTDCIEPALFQHVRAKLQHGITRSAEDIVQEVAMRFIRSLHQRSIVLENFSHLQGWFYRVAHNLVADEFRSEVRHPEAPLDDYIEGPYDPSQIDFLLDLNRGLKTLREPDRSLLASVVQGYRAPDIAGRTGSTVSTISKRIHRARKALREAMLDPHSAK